jgi:hypothetical protein
VDYAEARYEDLPKRPIIEELGRFAEILLAQPPGFLFRLKTLPLHIAEGLATKP